MYACMSRDVSYIVIDLPRFDCYFNVCISNLRLCWCLGDFVCSWAKVKK